MGATPTNAIVEYNSSCAIAIRVDICQQCLLSCIPSDRTHSMWRQWAQRYAIDPPCRDSSSYPFPHDVFAKVRYTALLCRSRLAESCWFYRLSPIADTKAPVQLRESPMRCSHSNVGGYQCSARSVLGASGVDLLFLIGLPIRFVEVIP